MSETDTPAAPASRYFFGFTPSAAWIKDFRKNISEVQPLLGDHVFRWVPDINWHITLLYLGVVSNEDAHQMVRERTMPAIKRFRFEARHFAFFGKHSPRALAIEFGPHPLALKLQDWCAQKVSAYEEITPERYASFRPHLTFARHRGQMPPDTQALLTYRLYQAKVQPPAFEVRQLILFKTEIHQKQTRYLPQAKYGLDA